MRVSELLERTMRLLGANGKNWLNRCPVRSEACDDGLYCTLTAIAEAGRLGNADSGTITKAVVIIEEIISNSSVSVSVPRWNDSASWEDVRYTFRKAQKIAQVMER